MQNHLVPLCRHHSSQHASKQHYKKHQLLFTMFVFIALCFALLTASPAWSATTSTDIPEYAREPELKDKEVDWRELPENAYRNYENIVLNRRGVHPTDPNIWVYTAEFAKRFRMPTEWIEKDLLGAEALAFRMTPYFKNCGWGGDKNACNDTQKLCVVDMYFDNNKQKLPWDPKMRWTDFDPLSNSSFFLSMIRTRDRLYGSAGQLRTPFTDPISKKELQWQELSMDGNQVLASTTLRGYDRSVFEGMSMVSLWIFCRDHIGTNLREHLEDSKNSNFPKVRFPKKWRENILNYIKDDDEKNNKFYKSVFDKLKK